MKRYSILPVQHHDLWEMYKAARYQVWFPDEVNLGDDNFDNLNPQEQKILKTVLAFFAVSDGVVNDNIAETLLPFVEQPEAEFFYRLQMMVEDIHNEMYGLFIDRYITDEKEREEMFNPIENLETVSKKANWALKWLGSTEEMSREKFLHRLVAFAVVEGLFFSGLFSVVFYFRSKPQLPGFIQGNDFINKEENSHYEFAVYYYNNYIDNPLNADTVRQIIMEAYHVEQTFISECLDGGLPGFSPAMGEQYIKFVTDTILSDFGLEKEFNVSNPLPWMERIAMESKNNFFEKRGGEYTRAEKSDDLFSEDF